MKMGEAVKNKLVEIVTTFEREKGELALFACVWREDIKKWDIVLSGDWVDYGKLKENIGYIFDTIKTKFNGEFALRFSGIFPLVPEEPFVKNVLSLFPDTEDVLELDETTFGDITVDGMVIFVSKKDNGAERPSGEVTSAA